MNGKELRKLLVSPWKLHALCCFTALAAGVIVIWPRIMPRAVRAEAGPYAGWVMTVVFVASLLLMTAACVLFLCRFRNLRTIGQFSAWLGCWLTTVLIFLGLSVIADPPPPIEKEQPQPIQQTDTLFLPHDFLTGPDALLLPINPESHTAERIISPAALLAQEKDNPDLLHRFLSVSPKWAQSSRDDTFYSKPGHVVMEPPGTTGIPGHVHVSFRHIVEGEPLPTGFTVVKPGDEFPAPAANNTPMPDLALELGGSHYLLLAWRGTSHHETACKAINAAIAAVDARLEPLAADPSAETIGKMLEGKRNTLGSTPELRLCEPPAQYGTYQTEIFANTGEPGTLLLIIRNRENGRTLNVFACPSRYSADPNELFRHDIPGDVPGWLRSSIFDGGGSALATGTPLYIISKGESHHYFGADFEVWFRPTDTMKPRRLILRRCYKVQSAEENAPAAPLPVPHS